jgi:hypothetical protein
MVYTFTRVVLTHATFVARQLILIKRKTIADSAQRQKTQDREVTNEHSFYPRTRVGGGVGRICHISVRDLHPHSEQNAQSLTAPPNQSK